MIMFTVDGGVCCITSRSPLTFNYFRYKAKPSGRFATYDEAKISNQNFNLFKYFIQNAAFLFCFYNLSEAEAKSFILKKKLL